MEVNTLTVVESGLIPIYTNETDQRVVNARELHAYLEVGKEYTNWIKDRIKKYGFIEGTDYVTFAEIGKREVGATVKTEYIFNLDAAKEIAMVQNNDKGREIRKYFIEVEKKYRDSQFQQFEEFKKSNSQLLLYDLGARRAEIDSKLIAAKVKEYSSYGISKTETGLLILQAKDTGENMDIMVHDILITKHNKELTKKRGRIYVRLQLLGSIYQNIYPNLDEDPFKHAWHKLADELHYDLGHTVNWQKRHEKDKAKVDEFNATRTKGVVKKQYPSYLDYIEEDDCFKEAEKAAERLIKKAKKIQEKKDAQKEEVVDDLRAL
jgi:phage anti-repressor protein